MVHITSILNSPKGGNNIEVHQLKNENKMWYTRTIEYYSAVKRNEALIHVTWTDVRGWTLKTLS